LLVVILTEFEVHPEEFGRRTGWAIKPQGACKDVRCVRLPDRLPDGRVDARVLSERLGMPLVQDEATGLLALGPESGGRALASAEAPELTLPDWRGEEFRLSSLRGQKVLLVCWASW
jgi:hypothetical protein